MSNVSNVVDIDVDMSVEDSVHSFLLYKKKIKKRRMFVCENNTNLKKIFPDIFNNNDITKKGLVNLLAYFECQCFKADFSEKKLRLYVLLLQKLVRQVNPSHLTLISLLSS